MIRRTGSRGQEQETINPIDRDEQDRITNGIISEAKQYSKRMRILFTWLYIVISFIFINLLIYSSLYPMVVSHQSVFLGLVPHYFFQIFYVFTSASFYGNARILNV